MRNPIFASCRALAGRALVGSAAVTLVAVTLAGCGTPAGRAVTTSELTRSPQQLAEADAASMLAAFRPPPGALPSGRLAVSALAAPPEMAATPDLVIRTGWWHVGGKPQAIIDWVKAHGPAGYSAAGGGSVGEPDDPAVRFTVFSLPPVAQVISQRWLLVSVAQYGEASGGNGGVVPPGASTAGGSGGVVPPGASTAIRVDVEVAWLPSKPTTERIPADAQVVTLAPLPGLGPQSQRPAATGNRPVTITDPAKVAAIAAVVDGLPLFPPGTYSCPADFGTGIQLTFRASVHGPVLAVVTDDNSGCGTVSVTISGWSMPALWHGEQLAQQALAIAGVHWPGIN
jgi:hypothetical protein